jgi:hypothetical protein
MSLLPPLTMWLCVAEPERRRVRVWLPLFLVWLILLPLVLLVFVCAVIADVVLLLTGARYHRYSLLLLRLWELLAQTRGTVVRVNDRHARFEMTIG